MKKEPTSLAPVSELDALGAQLRARRKALGVSMVAAAEVAGISRVTLHRIERGEPSVAVGAWMRVVAALGLSCELHAAIAGDADSSASIPVQIRLADYPQLRKLAWQVHGVDALTPLEAWGIYARNVRHLDERALDERERDLIANLRNALGKSDDRL